MKKLILEYFLGLIVAVGIYTLLDFLYCTFLTNSPFVISFNTFLIPAALWTLVMIVTSSIKKSKDKDKKDNVDKE